MRQQNTTRPLTTQQACTTSDRTTRCSSRGFEAPWGAGESQGDSLAEHPPIFWLDKIRYRVLHLFYKCSKKDGEIMASIDCAKYTSGQVGGLSVHFDKDKRLECEHENPHIDKSKTHLNSFHDCSGYSDMLRKQKERVAKMDELHPPERVRKDRITAIMMEIPVPKAISDKGLTDQFLKDTYAMIGEMVGKENMCGMTTHRDEVHDYIDHGGAVRTSLEHGHAMVVPYAHWTAKETVYGEDGKPLRDEDGKILKQSVEREGVNAKHFLPRSFLKQLQDKMQEMVLEKYDISYQTSQEPLHMTVEDLKRESARAAAIIDRAEQHAEQTKAELEKTSEELSEARTELQETQQGVNTLQEQQRALEAQIKADREYSRKQREAYDKNNAVLARQKEAITQNEDTMQRQAKMIELINSDIEYQQHAGELSTTMDGLEETLERLPKFARLFKDKEARSFVSDFMKSIRKVMDGLQAGINRLIVWELKKQPEKKLSEPLEERKASIMEQIASATERSLAQSRQSSKGQKKEGPVR